ncbi:uncharacterized protein [Oryctolagus cuniculus]|uniref:uncharacterized protein n=1 Tax=Oryctolagus cuniculus TaxID=9986 RepID=UPI00048B7ED2
MGYRSADCRCISLHPRPQETTGVPAGSASLGSVLLLPPKRPLCSWAGEQIPRAAGAPIHASAPSVGGRGGRGDGGRTPSRQPRRPRVAPRRRRDTLGAHRERPPHPVPPRTLLRPSQPLPRLPPATAPLPVPRHVQHRAPLRVPTPRGPPHASPAAAPTSGPYRCLDSHYRAPLQDPAGPRSSCAPHAPLQVAVLPRPTPVPAALQPHLSSLHSPPVMAHVRGSLGRGHFWLLWAPSRLFWPLPSFPPVQLRPGKAPWAWSAGAKLRLFPPRILVLQDRRSPRLPILGCFREFLLGEWLSTRDPRGLQKQHPLLSEAPARPGPCQTARRHSSDFADSALIKVMLKYNN